MTGTDLETPVTVLAGYLGAGKTTLLNRILSEKHGARYAVIVNEFGEIGIDGGLIVSSEEEIFEMNNGCICCSVRGDLIRILEGLMRRRRQFDGILVETTGLADPAPVAQTFFVDDDLRRRIRLDAIVTVVDALHFLGEVERAHEAEVQVAFADVILLNKTDLVGKNDLAKVESRICAINPYARLHRTERCGIDPGEVLGKGAFDLRRMLALEPALAGQARDRGHNFGIASLSLTAGGPLEPGKVLPWLQGVTERFGADILRMKGILSMWDDPDRFVVQGVHMFLEGDHQRPWKRSEKRESRLVFIGRNLPMDLLREGFAACQA